MSTCEAEKLKVFKRDLSFDELNDGILPSLDIRKDVSATKHTNLGRKWTTPEYMTKSPTKDLSRLGRCVNTEEAKYKTEVLVGKGTRTDMLKAFAEEYKLSQDHKVLAKFRILYSQDRDMILEQAVIDSFDRFQTETMTTLVSKALDVPESVGGIVAHFTGTLSVPGFIRLDEFGQTHTVCRKGKFHLFDIDFTVLQKLWNNHPANFGSAFPNYLPPFSTNSWFQSRFASTTKWNRPGKEITETYCFYKVFNVRGQEHYFALLVQETRNEDFERKRRRRPKVWDATLATVVDLEDKIDVRLFTGSDCDNHARAA